MKRRPPFDLATTPIADGMMLIEASAGTGKTFTISGLVLRLLLERPDLTIDRILVTTFTELATAELRGRIRERLRETIAVLRGALTSDESLRALVQAQPDPVAAAQRLQDAVLNFDEAPIYTIHGFCQRVLTERAFESGALFDAELVTNQAELLREVANDFWRIHFYGGEKFTALLALKNKITPEKLLKDLEEATRNPELRILPNEWKPLREIAAEVAQVVQELRADWKTEEPRIRQLFIDNGWAKGTHEKADRMARMLDDLGACLGEGGGSAEQLSCLDKLARRAVHAATRVRFEKPQSPVFDLCERLLDLEKEFSVALQAEFFAWARAALRDRKSDRNVFSFDDLLTRLDAALARPGGEELAQSMRTKYQAALIDEFQDTDPVQYSIFSRIYGGSDAPVALIGDPKQAIYAFRGADVFTYMKAASEAPADRQFTLTTNWRSESGLVNAVNTIFDHEQPFLLDEIPFDAVQASPQADVKKLAFAGKLQAPFQLWLADGEDDDLFENVASEVVRLLTSDATIGGEPLAPQNIAILTNTNAQAAQVQEVLRTRRIPSVLYSTANIFSTHEARELRDVLAAVVQPGYEKFVRAALITDALGRSANDLDAFTRDETAWETEQLRFHKYHELWRERGFIRMLRELGAENDVRRRLLGFADGERRLTNFLQLAELLHSACVEHRLGMNGLLKWLGQRMQEPSYAQREEHELRLESDERAVRILTIHKSKGLEFDVVLCPFVSSGGILRSTFHDPDAENALTLDLLEPKGHKERREEELLAEKLRQFYVALTRAKHRCGMIWQPGANSDTSAPGYLLGNPSALPPKISACPDIEVQTLPAATTAVWVPNEEGATKLEPRMFNGRIDPSWGIASFTRLISGREADELDEGPLVEIAPEDEAAVATGIHAFPRGMSAGTCLHEILELVDFAQPATAAEIVERRLRAYGIENFDETIAENIRALAAHPLVSETDRFTLGDVPAENHKAELEFFFPINELTTQKLAQVLGLPEVALRLERLQFQTMNGFMNGFIDLTFEHGGRFYFVDWKSNWLGTETRAYRPAVLAAEMERNFYTLQLCIYSVALHRYLRVRKPDYDFEQHFGGAFYIFLRGIDPAQPKSGVHFQRLSRGLVEELSGIFER